MGFYFYFEFVPKEISNNVSCFLRISGILCNFNTTFDLFDFDPTHENCTLTFA